MSDRFFKFLKADGSPTHGPKSFRWPVPNGAAGEWVRVEGELIPCENGLHLVRFAGWREWCSALMYECEGRGECVAKDENVEVFREARLVRKVEAWNERNLRLFACDCAERVIHLYEDKYPGDVRLRYCIDTARAFADGKATQRELTAARAAAWAARAAAWAAGVAAWATWAAAWAAGVSAWATWAAARAAAWAAGDAARAAAWAAGDAARAAAWAAAGAAGDAARAAGAAARAAARAAGDAEIAWQDKRLLEILGL